MSLDQMLVTAGPKRFVLWCPRDGFRIVEAFDVAG